MQTELVLLEKKDNIAIVTLNQPEILNAMTNEMASQFRNIILNLQKDSDIRVVILAGKGRAFCTGGDVKSFMGQFNRPTAEIQPVILDFYKSFLSIQNLSVPTIAAIQGPTVGAGLCLAMACDMRIASEDVKLAMSFVNVGLNPGMGGTAIMSQLIGTAKTMELCLTGDIVNATEALRIGLVNHVVDVEHLMEFTMNIAEKIANKPPVTTKLIKQAIIQNKEVKLESALITESFSQVICASTEDMKEALIAMKEKRTPVYKGK